jgi:hypothetical protein
MSWNRTTTDSSSLRKNKLVENNDFNELQNNYLQLLKKYELIKDYSEQLENINYGDYKDLSRQYQSKMVELPQEIAYLKNLLNKVKNDKSNDNLYEQIQSIDDNLKSKETDFQVVLNKIVSREKALKKRFTLMVLPDSLTQENEMEDMEDDDMDESNQNINDDKRQSKMLATRK